jgi:hypothetical protein
MRPALLTIAQDRLCILVMAGDTAMRAVEGKYPELGPGASLLLYVFDGPCQRAGRMGREVNLKWERERYARLFTFPRIRYAAIGYTDFV